MVGRCGLVADVVTHRALIAEELPRERSIEDGHRLRLLLIALQEGSPLQERNAERVEESVADMVFFSVHLCFGQFRVTGDVDGSVPYAAGNPAHLKGSIADKRECLERSENSGVQGSEILPVETAAAKIKMD